VVFDGGAQTQQALCADEPNPRLAMHALSDPTPGVFCWGCLVLSAEAGCFDALSGMLGMSW
jgi:hypothetical protein